MSGRGIQFEINKHLCLKDPQMTNYGQKLISESIVLFHEIGFEQFTFRKLAAKMDSTEASVYRYFENKHTLLLWLICWYWEWVHYLIDINIKNIEDVERKLKIVIHNIVNASTESPLTSYINENMLHRVVINESSKTYHIHEVDVEEKHGHFKSYEELVAKVSSIIVEFNPKFKYPKILASNLFEMANNQIYFAEHMPDLTDIKNRKDKHIDLENAMVEMSFKLLS